MAIQLYNCVFVILHTHEAITFYDKHTNRKVMVSDLSTHHGERQFQRVQTFLSTVFSQRTQHSNADVSHSERSNKRSPHKCLTENREAKQIRECTARYNKKNCKYCNCPKSPNIISAHYVLSVSGIRSWTSGRTTPGEWPAVRTSTWWAWPTTTREYTQVHSLKHR
jgi:hypothetical protein